MQIIEKTIDEDLIKKAKYEREEWGYINRMMLHKQENNSKKEI